MRVTLLSRPAAASAVGAPTVCVGVSKMTAGLGMPVEEADRTGVTRNAYVVPVVNPPTTWVSKVVVAPDGAPLTATADVKTADESPQSTEQYSTL